MQVDRTVLVGAGAGIVGLLLGLAIGWSGRSELEARAAAQDEIRAQVAALTETVAGIETRLGGVAEQVTALGASQAGGIENLAKRLEGAVAGAGTTLSDSLGDELASLRALAESQAGNLEGVAKQLEGAAAAIGSSTSEALGENLERLRVGIATLARTGEGETAAGTGEALSIGQTAELADGKLRVFLSAVDTAAGTARVAVNGTALSEVSMTEPVEAGDCKLELTGVAEGGATFNAAC
jgi:hypothetical protein